MKKRKRSKYLRKCIGIHGTYEYPLVGRWPEKLNGPNIRMLLDTLESTEYVWFPTLWIPRSRT